MLLFLLQVLSEAQDEVGYCAFYEECGLNPLLDDKEPLIDPIVPCLNSTRAIPLSGEHYRKLKQVCCSRGAHIPREYRSFLILLKYLKDVLFTRSDV